MLSAWAGLPAEPGESVHSGLFWPQFAAPLSSQGQPPPWVQRRVFKTDQQAHGCTLPAPRSCSKASLLPSLPSCYSPGPRSSLKWVPQKWFMGRMCRRALRSRAVGSPVNARARSKTCHQSEVQVPLFPLCQALRALVGLRSAPMGTNANCPTGPTGQGRAGRGQDGQCRGSAWQPAGHPGTPALLLSH